MSEQRAPYLTHQVIATPYEDVRYPDGKLAFRFDPKRKIVQIQRNGQLYYFDLEIYPAEPLYSEE